jgi:deoxyribonucleoside regulator
MIKLRLHMYILGAYVNNRSLNLGAQSEQFVDLTKSHLITRVAWLYYMEELTQQEIGNRLGLSRVTINRLLQQARQDGTVQITVKAPNTTYFAQEQALCRTFGLQDAVVVTCSEPGEPLYLALAQGAADWLIPRLKTNIHIGMGYGRTLSHLPLVVRNNKKVDCVFTEVMGGVGDHESGFKSYNVVSKMAELVNGRVNYVYAPSIVSTEEARQTFLKEEAIANSLDVARQCDILLHSVGPVDDSALLYVHDYLQKEDLAELQQKGAVGDTLGRYFDAQGNHIEQSLDNRIIGITLDDIRQIPLKVLVAGGSEKTPVIRAAIHGDLLNVLITDHVTAQALLEGA